MSGSVTFEKKVSEIMQKSTNSNPADSKNDYFFMRFGHGY